MTTASPQIGNNFSTTGSTGSYIGNSHSTSAPYAHTNSNYNNNNNNMYSQHGHHLLSSSGAGQHHHAGTYGSTGAATNANSHHTSSTDTGLAPQSSFDTVPGSQHTSSLHQSPNSGTGGWGQSMHYSNSANGTAYGSNASHGMYGSSNYYGSTGTQAPSGAVTGSNGAGSGAYSAYGMQTAGSGGGGNNAQAHSAYGNNAIAGGINGSTGGGSAHHSGASTPTSQTAYHHQHPHSLGSVFPSPQGYPTHHQGGYYGTHGSVSSNSAVSSSPSYTSAPQYSTQLPLAGRHRVTTTLWEDEGTLCFQVDARGVCVARRHDNNMINGTKLLNVCGMSRGKRDGILKNEKERIVVKVGAMHLKGVWITFQRGKQLAEQNNILDVLYPLFEQNIQSFLYHPDNYPRTAAVMAAAQERHAQRSRASLGTDSPTGYQRASSQTTNGSLSNGANPPPLMRSNTTPNAPLAPGAYGHTNGYNSAPGHSPSGHLGAHLGGGGSNGGAIPQRPSPVDRRVVTPFDSEESYINMMKPRTHSGQKREFQQSSTFVPEQGMGFDERV